MSEAKFTKGPWGRTLFANGQPRVYRIGRDYKEADIAHTHGNDDVANADLIAAAPEMYAMLEKLLEPYGREDVSDEQIEALLAKARGEV